MYICFYLYTFKVHNHYRYVNLPDRTLHLLFLYIIIYYTINNHLIHFIQSVKIEYAIIYVYNIIYVCTIQTVHLCMLYGIQYA